MQSRSVERSGTKEPNVSDLEIGFKYNKLIVLQPSLGSKY
jgi:hypothetical protein